MNCFHSILYLVLISLLAFPLGRLLPKKWFHFDRFPFRACAFEKEGRIYNALHIRDWQNKLPDMSKLFPVVMKRKELPKHYTGEDLRYLLDETCIAEVVHACLSVAALPCTAIWEGVGGWCFYLLYVLFGNLPYILIQRYNRPRLARLYHRIAVPAQPARERLVD